MKTQVIRMFLAVGAVAAFGGTVHAQTFDLVANVPFSFQVGDRTFDAGKYKVMRHGSETLPSLQSAVTGRSIIIGGASPILDGKSNPKVVFHCYGGDKCFLAEFWPGVGAGSTVPKSKTEKALINGDQTRQMASVAIEMHRAD